MGTERSEDRRQLTGRARGGASESQSSVRWQRCGVEEAGIRTPAFTAVVSMEEHSGMRWE